MKVSERASSIQEYIDTLPADRVEAIKKIRAVILKNLPEGFQEAFNWGMLSYEIPLETYPNTYNGQPLMYAALASQKNYISVYLLGVYGHKETYEWFTAEFAKTGEKLNMGKSCLRLKKVTPEIIDLIGRTIARISVKKYIEYYEKVKRK